MNNTTSYARKILRKMAAMALPRAPINVGDKVFVTINPQGVQPRSAYHCARDTTTNKAYVVVEAGKLYREQDGRIARFLDDTDDCVGLQVHHLTRVVS